MDNTKDTGKKYTGDRISRVKVMQDAEGYFVGILYKNGRLDEHGLNYSKFEPHFKTIEEAEEKLKLVKKMMQDTLNSIKERSGKKMANKSNEERELLKEDIELREWEISKELSQFKPVRLEERALTDNDVVSDLKIVEDHEGFYVGTDVSNVVGYFTDIPFMRYTPHLETKEKAEEYFPVVESMLSNNKKIYKKFKSEKVDEEIEPKFREIEVDGQKTIISEIEVQRSNAGYFIGRQCVDLEMTGELEEGQELSECGVWVPYDRLSVEYFRDISHAETALKTGKFTLRDNSLGFVRDAQIDEYFNRLKKESKGIKPLISESIDD